jgi:glycosyltransferase involved in cell wall biosynthesis
MSRIIIFSYEEVFPEYGSSGPSIRNWEIAKALTRRGHKVTIAEKEHKKDYIKNKIKFISWDEDLLNNIEENFDVALIQNSHLVREYFNKIDKIPTIINLTIPISVEASAHQIRSKEEFFINDGLVPTAVSLMKGDFFFCASERQKHFYMGMLNLLGRINPYTYDKNLIDIVPVAAPVEIPEIKENIIKGKVVPKNKRIILWPSSIFSWFDAITAIEAMKIVSDKVKDAVMVFVGADNPNISIMTRKNVDDAKKKAKKLNLLNKSVYFMDWLPYEKRANMYLESEFAVVTYPIGPETEMSFRTRITDCLWGRLPVICTKGDSVAEIIEKENLGSTVEEKNPKELAEKIVDFLNNQEKLERISKKVDKFVKEKMNWDVVIEPIDKFCKNPKVDKHKERITQFSIINEKEKIINEKEKIIQNQKKHIDYLEADLNGHAREVKKLNDLIKDKDRINYIKRIEEIKKINEITKEWNKEIKRINEEHEKEIDKRDKNVRYLNEEIKRINEEHEKEIDKRDKNVRYLNEEIKRINEEIREKDDMIKQLNNQLKEIKSSRGYKFLNKIHNTRKRLGLT